MERGGLLESRGRPRHARQGLRRAVRRYTPALRRRPAGAPKRVVAGYARPFVGKSLALLHGHVDHPWTITELAEAVGTSRPVLVDRSERCLLEPPVAYLTRWWLQLAAQALTTTPRGASPKSRPRVGTSPRRRSIALSSGLSVHVPLTIGGTETRCRHGQRQGERDDRPPHLRSWLTLPAVFTQLTNATETDNGGRRPSPYRDDLLKCKVFSGPNGGRHDERVGVHRRSLV